MKGIKRCFYCDGITEIEYLCGLFYGLTSHFKTVVKLALISNYVTVEIDDGKAKFDQIKELEKRFFAMLEELKTDSVKEREKEQRLGNDLGNTDNI